jgi:predicted cupin superfamily sugar epimerase
VNRPPPPVAGARAIIRALGLEPLPGEGGFFRATWANETCSAIFFLLTRDAFSALHCLDRDELWHFYAGQPVEHLQLDPNSGTARVTRMGPDVLAGELPQLPVSAGVWQGARLVPHLAMAADYALLGCTVSPPWDERGFTLGQRDRLTRLFPAQATLIQALTR